MVYREHSMPTAPPKTDSLGAAGNPALLATKLHLPLPRPRERVVLRPRLSERLDQRLGSNEGGWYAVCA